MSANLNKAMLETLRAEIKAELVKELHVPAPKIEKPVDDSQLVLQALKIVFDSAWAKATAFSTGSRGYNGGGKLIVNGKKYQAQIRLVEIGSKPK